MEHYTQEAEADSGIFPGLARSTSSMIFQSDSITSCVTVGAHTSKKLNAALYTSTRTSSPFKLATEGSGASVLSWSLDGCAWWGITKARMMTKKLGEAGSGEREECGEVDRSSGNASAGAPDLR
jgi:hypothetical protein